MTKFCLKKLKLFSVSAIGLKKDQIDSCFSFFWPQTSWSQFLLQLSASKNLKLISVSAFGLKKTQICFCFNFWPQKSSNWFFCSSFWPLCWSRGKWLATSKSLSCHMQPNTSRWSSFQHQYAFSPHAVCNQTPQGNLLSNASILSYLFGIDPKNICYQMVRFPTPVCPHIFLGLTQKHSLDGQNEFWPVWSS